MTLAADKVGMSTFHQNTKAPSPHQENLRIYCLPSETSTPEAQSLGDGDLSRDAPWKHLLILAGSYRNADLMTLCGMDGTTDPYVTVEVWDKVSERVFHRAQTAVKSNSQQPVWDEEFLFVEGDMQDFDMKHTEVRGGCNPSQNHQDT